MDHGYEAERRTSGEETGEQEAHAGYSGVCPNLAAVQKRVWSRAPRYNWARQFKVPTYSVLSSSPNVNTRPYARIQVMRRIHTQQNCARQSWVGCQATPYTGQCKIRLQGRVFADGLVDRKGDQRHNPQTKQTGPT